MKRQNDNCNMKKVGINGFGRIGRLALRIILTKYLDRIEVPIVNTSGSVDTVGWANLFEFDTTYRRFPSPVEVEGDYLMVNNQRILLTGFREPDQIPWDNHGVETVIESTGVFTKKEDLAKHIRGSVKQVILSAPAKGDGVPMVVLGINDQAAQGQSLISNASCTTNCVSPVTQVILEKFGIEKAAMTTVHAYTSDQNLHDNSHKDLRRARAAALNIVPTTTGAAVSVTQVLPILQNKFDGVAIRVPVATGSLTDFTFLVSRSVTKEEINQALIEASQSDRLKKYLWVTDKPIVSSDVIGCEASAWVDLNLTQVIDGNLVKIFAWYDNEWGYANRLVEQALFNI